MMNKTVEINQLNEELSELEYDKMLLESELKNCENQALGESLFNELLKVKTKIAVLKDVNGLSQ